MVTLAQGDEDYHPDDDQVERQLEFQRVELQRWRARGAALQDPRAGTSNNTIRIKRLRKE